MAKINSESLYQKQKKVRPKIDDVIGDFICDNSLEHATAFIAYLRENKMPPQWGSGNSWTVSYKNKRVCYIRVAGTSSTQKYHHLEPGSWHISFNGNYSSSECENCVIDEAMKPTVWNNIKYCVNCSVCGPGVQATILGKDFDMVCRHMYIVMNNPDTAAIECAKKLIEIRKTEICHQ